MGRTKYTTPEQIAGMRQEIQQEKERLLYKKTGKKAGQEERRGRWKKAAGTILFSLLVLLLISALVTINLAKNKGEIPDILGFHLFIIESGSMEPTLTVGSVIITQKPEQPDSLAVNSIITFKTSAGEVVTHRIIEVVTEGETINYRTKGDNPINSPDQELVDPERVIGVFMAKLPLT